MTQLDLTFSVAESRDLAISQVERNAGESFMERATSKILATLYAKGECSGEYLTDACLEAGIVPHDDRAFGAVYRRLSCAGVIEKCGTCQRTKGHLTGGGNVWRLRQ